MYYNYDPPRYIVKLLNSKQQKIHELVVQIKKHKSLLTLKENSRDILQNLEYKNSVLYYKYYREL